MLYSINILYHQKLLQNLSWIKVLAPSETSDKKFNQYSDSKDINKKSSSMKTFGHVPCLVYI